MLFCRSARRSLTSSSGLKRRRRNSTFSHFSVTFYTKRKNLNKLKESLPPGNFSRVSSMNNDVVCVHMLSAPTWTFILYTIEITVPLIYIELLDNFLKFLRSFIKSKFYSQSFIFMLLIYFELFSFDDLYYTIFKIFHLYIFLHC